MIELITWLLDKVGALLRGKPKLYFQMTATPDDELSEKELRTKTSLSEYGIEIFNRGEKTIIIESITLTHRKKTIADCFFFGDERFIEPSRSMIYIMMEQDADALEWHCKQSYFEECDVIAHCVGGKDIKGKLQVPLIAIRAKLSTSDDVFYN